MLAEGKLTREALIGAVDACYDKGLPLEKAATVMDTLLVDTIWSSEGFSKGFREVMEQATPEVQEKVASLVSDPDFRRAYLTEALRKQFLPEQ